MRNLLFTLRMTFCRDDIRESDKKTQNTGENLPGHDAATASFPVPFPRDALTFDNPARSLNHTLISWVTTPER
jgi:hypothetical protein